MLNAKNLSAISETFVVCNLCDGNLSINGWLVPHCCEIVQIRSFFWSIFFRVWTQCKDLFCKYTDSVQIHENTNLKKLRILTLFAGCNSPKFPFPTCKRRPKKLIHKRVKVLTEIIWYLSFCLYCPEVSDISVFSKKRSGNSVKLKKLCNSC